MYETAAGAHSTRELVQVSIEPISGSENGQKESPNRIQADVDRLAQRIDTFSSAFRDQFSNTALCESGQPFSVELVEQLHDFLQAWIPDWFPLWDHNPFTRYSHEEQVTNFSSRTLRHIELAALYVREYSRLWNEQIAKHCSELRQRDAALLDENYMMCRALLHDLGRFFTQDPRAHEEIPAFIALRSGLRRDLLTLDDGNPASHPRDFSIIDMSKKQFVRMIDFFSDFFSKPHHDGIWPEIIERMNDDGSKLPADEIRMIIQKAELLRQMELRHPDLALQYFLFSALGYQEVLVGESKRWLEILEERYAADSARLKYYLTEARMLREGMAFLQALGISPRLVRERVERKWTSQIRAQHAQTVFEQPRTI
jgi:hypothetical protein